MAIPTIEADHQTWARVGKQVRIRRSELGLSISSAVARAGGGIQQTTWSKLENAQQESFSQRSLYAVARALGWSSDSVERMIEGRSPVEIGDADRVQELTRLNWLIEGEARDVVAGIQGLADALESLQQSVLEIEERLRRLEEHS